MTNSTAVEGPDLVDLAQQEQRMQELMYEVEELPESPAKSLAQDCIEEILSYHNTGLQRMLQMLRQQQATVNPALMDQLLEDPIISGLLLMHDLHPQADELEQELERP